MIFIVVILIAIISVLLSLWSLHNLRKMKEVTQAQQDLSKSKILFQHDSTVSPIEGEASESQGS